MKPNNGPDKFKAIAEEWPVLFSAVAWLALFLLYFSLTAIGAQREGGRQFKAMFVFAVTSFALVLSLFWNGYVSRRIFMNLWPDLEKRQQNVLKWAICIGLLAVSGCCLYTVKFPFSGVAGGQMLELISATPHPLLREQILTLLNETNALALLAVLGSITACSAIALPTRKELSQGLQIHQVAYRIRCFRMSLYSSAIVLGLGLVEIVSLYRWAEVIGADAASSRLKEGLSVEFFGWFKISTQSVPAESLNAFAPVADGLGFAAGIAFTILLLLIYVPVGLVLEKKLSKLTSAAAIAKRQKFDLPKWQLEHEITGSPLAALGSYLALLSPLLTATLSKLFNTL